jgi:hypothetical protein
MRERRQDWAERVESEGAETLHLVVSEKRLGLLHSSQTVYQEGRDQEAGPQAGAALHPLKAEERCSRLRLQKW